MLRSTLPALAFSLIASLLAGCAESAATPPKTPENKPAPGAQTTPAASASPPVAPGHLARGDVEGVLRKGPPWLLRRVTMEEVIREGRFIGWRILQLSFPEDWKVDLKPGDIVTKVNSLPLERPDDLWAAWLQLYSAIELRLSCEREGRPVDIVLPIDGPSSAAASLAQVDTQPPPPPRPSRWQTVVIESDDGIPPAGDPQD